MTSAYLKEEIRRMGYVPRIDRAVDRGHEWVLFPMGAARSVGSGWTAGDERDALLCAYERALAHQKEKVA